MKKLELTNFKNLPKPISNEELKELFIQFHNGDISARTKIIKYNLRLVVNELCKKYWNVLYDKNDLFEIGVLGLIHAVDHYDINKDYYFSTYATICIDREIANTLSKTKYKSQEFEPDNPIKRTNNENVYYYDLYEDNFIDTIDNHMMIISLLDKLNERDKQIIILYYGLFNNNKYTQIELGKMFNLSQKGIALIIEKNLRKMKKNIIFEEKQKGLS